MENYGKLNRQKTVVVGMSGGVDSSVAAWLLKEAGYRVIGVTMETWLDGNEHVQSKSTRNENAQEQSAQNENVQEQSARDENAQEQSARNESVQTQNAQNVCSDNCDKCSLSAVKDAQRVAQKLSIPHYVVDFRREFQCQVVDYFVDEYWHGRTPNPCIVCNRFVKWEALLRRSRDFGADFIATGHYARIEQLKNGRYTLRECAVAGKDQTYALYNLTQDQLSRTLMPLGDYTKEKVRRMAEEIGLFVADKPDSQEICFIPDHDYAGFIEQYSGREAKPGNFVDKEGNILGQHRGIIHYTIGQRKGLGLSCGRRIFVQEIRPESNEVVIGEGNEVFSHTLHCTRINWMGIDGLGGKELTVCAKIRYSDKGETCVVRQVGEDLLECRFVAPVRAVTPGQAVVFYLDGVVLGGGTIV